MTKTSTDQEIALEQIARDCVDNWIENRMAGYEMRHKMQDRINTLAAFLERDITTFERTGKYPQYA